MIDLTTDTHLDLVVLAELVAMLLLGQVVQKLFDWVGRHVLPASAV